MPVGSVTSPTLRRLSLTKPVSSCPIPDNSFQHFAIVLDRQIKSFSSMGFREYPRGIDPINGADHRPRLHRRSEGASPRPCGRVSCLALSSSARELLDEAFRLPEPRLAGGPGASLSRGSEHGELIGDLQPPGAKAIERGGPAAG